MWRRCGFTLIELLVVLVILGVVASQAMPAFQQHVIRTRRGEAQAALLQLMQQEERFYSQNNRYLAFSSSSTETEERQFKWWSGGSASGSAYEVEGKACDGEQISQCVQLIAMPGTAMVDARFRDEECERLILTSTGLHVATGNGLRCWL